MRKRILAIGLSVFLLFTLVACGRDTGDTGDETVEPTDVVETEDTSTEESIETDFTAEQPVLLTSVGQSADVEMVKQMLDNIGVDATTENLATSDDLTDVKTLVLAIGGSSKGLGAAGIDADEELARVEELIDAANAEGLKVVAMHIGGDARRGDLSDTFIKPSFDGADYAIVVKGGDSDGLMSGLAGDNGIPIDLIDSLTDAPEALENIFD